MKRAAVGAGYRGRAAWYSVQLVNVGGRIVQAFRPQKKTILGTDIAF